MFKTGVVASYNPQKGYGFLRLEETGEEIFFHINDGRSPKVKGGQIELSSRGKQLMTPIQGEVIVFQRTMDPRGPRAIRWTYRTLYEHTLRTIRSGPLMYRAREVVILPGADVASAPRTTWEGVNLRSPLLGTIWPMRESPSFTQGNCWVDRWFEVYKGGMWLKCDSDPRL